MKIWRISLICCVLLMIGFAGRGVFSDNAGTQERFEQVYEQKSSLSYAQILRDKETGVKYLYVKYGYGAAMVKLEEKP